MMRMEPTRRARPAVTRALVRALVPFHSLSRSPQRVAKMMMEAIRRVHEEKS